MPLLKVVVSSTRNSTETVAALERDLVDPTPAVRINEADQLGDNNSQDGSVSSPLLSATSTLSSKKGSIASQDICRICHCEAEFEAPLVAPCSCSGSLKFVHQGCLQRWVQSSDMKNCELCKYPFIMQTKIKPFREWEKLDMSSMERRKLACSVTFHAVAFTCVIWSLYVLIDRSAEEYSSGQLQWPFWTKLVVVAIGFTGGVVFMYVQCTMYLTLCRRWRAYNRVIVVQNAPSNSRAAGSHGSLSTAVQIGEGCKPPGSKRTNHKKPSVPVQSVVTIASAFTGGGRNGSKVAVDPPPIPSGAGEAADEEMTALLDVKSSSSVQVVSAPVPPLRSEDDSIPSIQNL